MCSVLVCIYVSMCLSIYLYLSLMTIFHKMRWDKCAYFHKNHFAIVDYFLFKSLCLGKQYKFALCYDFSSFFLLDPSVFLISETCFVLQAPALHQSNSSFFDF